MTPQPVHQRLVRKDLGDVTVASFTDRHLLAAQQLQAIGDQLTSMVEEMGRRKLILNFTLVRDISSLALGMLVSLNKKLRAVGGKLVLCGMDPQIRDLMALTQLDAILDIRGDEQDGLKAF